MITPTVDIVDDNSKVKDTFVRKMKPQTVVNRTGRSWEEWNAILDAWNVRQKGFTASARFLREQYGVSMWWSNTIVMRYEYVRDLR